MAERKKRLSGKQKKNLKKSSMGHQIYGYHKRGFGDRASDALSKYAGSWGFIIGFFIFLAIWMAINSYYIIWKKWDPYPFILLNLALSCLAAIQAPIILMSQNRQTERDRFKAERDHYINRKAERENIVMQRDLSQIKRMIRNLKSYQGKK